MNKQISFLPREGVSVLSRVEFGVLTRLLREKTATQRALAKELGVSLGSLNNAMKQLRGRGFVSQACGVTEQGCQELEKHRVSSAVILAAGTASRFAPLSFEKPRAMFEVRGEVLIERLIRQLKEAGVTDITVVVGYMKEAFFYLEDAFDVHIVVNDEYATRNNNYSLWCGLRSGGGRFSGTYICPADQYYSQNIFESYVLESYCGAVYCTDEFDGHVLTIDARNRVTGVRPGGCDALRMQGPACLDRASVARFFEILEAEVNLPETVAKLWDDILAAHIADVQLVAKIYDEDVIHEFDYVGDLVAFDCDFFANVDSRILDNISATLQCGRSDITKVEPINAGLTNLSVLFEAKGKKYVYRHPGNGTDEIINRKAEAHALAVAKRLGLDEGFVYEDPEKGWKISRFIEGCSEFDYRNRSQVTRALQLIRKLHTSGETSPWSFDFPEEAASVVRLLRGLSYPLPRDFAALEALAARASEVMRAEAGEPVLCHNDFYGPNLLVRGDEMWLIDWEYSAMGDYACDIGNFVAQGSGYSVQEARDILDLYYGRKPTPEEERHCLAAIGLVGYYWYVWAMYKEAMGNPVGEWLYVWYKAAKTFMAAALEA